MRTTPRKSRFAILEDCRVNDGIFVSPDEIRGARQFIRTIYAKNLGFEFATRFVPSRGEYRVHCLTSPHGRRIGRPRREESVSLCLVASLHR